MLYPFYYMITTSLHSSDQYQLGSGGYSLASWHNLFDVLPVWRELLNSTLVSARRHRDHPVRRARPAATRSAILRYRAATVAFLLVVGAMMVPLQSIIAPEFINIVELLADQPPRLGDHRVRGAGRAVLDVPDDDVPAAPADGRHRGGA